jgi:hypothetical protein
MPKSPGPPPPQRAHLVRSAVLTGYVDAARAAGLDPFRMIAGCGLPAACLTDPEAKIPTVSVLRLLDESARRSGRADFALRLAEKRSLSNVGALGLLVREQPTIRRAMEMLVGYMHLHSESILLSLEERDDAAILKLAIDVGRPLPVRQGIELGLGFLHRSLQQLLGERWKPLAVHFTYAAPEDRNAYRKFFRTELAFGQDFNGIICAARDLEVAVPAADAQMARQMQKYLDTIASRPRRTVSSDVRE